MLTTDKAPEEVTEKTWETYESLLRHHDWFYEYSDDHRVWNEGRLAYSRICNLRKRLGLEDPFRAQTIWNKHCPEQFKMKG